MKGFLVIAGLVMIALLAVAGCTNDPAGVIMGSGGGPEVTGTLVTAGGGTSAAPGGDWIFWRESQIELGKQGYSMERPNLDQRYFKDLKVEVATDAPVDVRFVTLAQSDAYQDAYRNFYELRTASSFDPDAAGYVKKFSAVNSGSVEAHGSEAIVIYIEPHAEQPAKGSVKMYYKF
jgi:hypothetical protein